MLLDSEDFVSVNLNLEQIVMLIKGLDMTSACLLCFRYHNFACLPMILGQELVAYCVAEMGNVNVTSVCVR